jgi:hypothetical protein
VKSYTLPAKAYIEGGGSLRRVLLVLVVFVGLYGCGGAEESDQVEEVKEPTTPAKTVSPPADVPAYDVTKDEEGAQMGLRVRNVSASTDATSEEDLEAITRELWTDGPEVDAMIVTFYPNEPTADPAGTGEAYRSEEAARTMISAMYADPSEADVEKQVRETLENGGIRVVSLEEEAESMTQEMCAEWDVTTMGTPPPEWNCPGY